MLRSSTFMKMAIKYLGLFFLQFCYVVILLKLDLSLDTTKELIGLGAAVIIVIAAKDIFSGIAEAIRSFPFKKDIPPIAQEDVSAKATQSVEAIERLNKLKETGVLSEAEFEKMKKLFLEL